MYVNNLSELSKALKSNQSSIKVKDKKLKTKIIKSAMKKGLLYSFDGQQISNSSKVHLPGMIPAVIAESTNNKLSIIGLISLRRIFALYRKYKSKIVISKDGTLAFENEDFPEIKKKEDKY